MTEGPRATETTGRTIIRRKNGEAIVMRDLKSEAETRVVYHGNTATLEIFHDARTLVLRAEILDEAPTIDQTRGVTP